MNAQSFQAQLRETGHYASPRGIRRHPLPSFLATPLFGLSMGPIFVRGYFHSKRPRFMEEKWSEFGFYVYRLVERLGGYIEIEGFQEISDLRQNVVWVSNHVSSLETYMLPPLLMTWPGLNIVLKESLAHYPLFGSVIRAVYPIRILRKNPIEDLRKVMREGAEGIHAGRSALIFPQGARYRQFDPATFNTLGTKLALHAKAPVVPIAVCTDFLRIGKKHRDLGSTIHPQSPVRIACGPILPPDLGQAEIQRRSVEFIVDKLAEWEKLDGRKLLVDSPADSKSASTSEA
ncbi:MAG: lysophospholipid acyltransferase family protein [Kiritimatiellia bacterium]|jgi:1-acyl-sn-glycerol-3-phosphate acyltransferase